MAKLTTEGKFLCWETTPEEYEQEIIEREVSFHCTPTFEEILKAEKLGFSERTESQLSEEMQKWREIERKKLECLVELMEKKQREHSHFSEPENTFSSDSMSFDEITRMLEEAVKKMEEDKS